MKLTLPDLRWNTALLNGLVALFFVGLVGMWLCMVDRIDDRFDLADTRNREIASAVTEIKVTSARQSAGIEAILGRLENDKPQGIPRAGSGGSVRQGP